MEEEGGEATIVTSRSIAEKEEDHGGKVKGRDGKEEGEKVEAEEEGEEEEEEEEEEGKGAREVSLLGGGGVEEKNPEARKEICATGKKSKEEEAQEEAREEEEVEGEGKRGKTGRDEEEEEGQGVDGWKESVQGDGIGGIGLGERENRGGGDGNIGGMGRKEVEAPGGGGTKRREGSGTREGGTGSSSVSTASSNAHFEFPLSRDIIAAATALSGRTGNVEGKGKKGGGREGGGLAPNPEREERRKGAEGFDPDKPMVIYVVSPFLPEVTVKIRGRAKVKKLTSAIYRLFCAHVPSERLVFEGEGLKPSHLRFMLRRDQEIGEKGGVMGIDDDGNGGNRKVEVTLDPSGYIGAQGVRDKSQIEVSISTPLVTEKEARRRGRQ